MMELWPHQQKAIDAIAEAMDANIKRILVTAPTGAGKGVILEKAMERVRSATLYTDRRMLLDQTAKRLDRAGFEYGIRAAGHEPRVTPNVQLCMIRTEESRVLRRKTREHHRSDLVILDEAHRNTGGGIRELIARHLKDGSTILGLTATPVGLSDQYDRLIVAAMTSDCRKCGALVPAITYAPDEPDLRHIKRQATGEYEVGALSKVYRRPVIFGRVISNWRRLNTEGRPTLLFGPDVDGAKWFCEELNKSGIPSGHIDGECVIIRNEVMPASTQSRQQLHDALKSGDIQIVTNRFVLREGIDWPWVSCMIFATAFGTLTSYLQSGGRGLRAAPGKKDCLVIDHGGNWHRLGSLNSDREWSLGKTDVEMVRERIEKIRSKAADSDPEPIVCPKCAAVRISGKQCHSCGFMSVGKTRMVVQVDGSLRQVRGDIYQPRKVSEDPDDLKAWKSIYWRCRKAKTPKTFSQAMGLFFREHGKWPNENWPYMPLDGSTKRRFVCDVPMNELRAPEPVNDSGLFRKGAA